MSAEPSHSAPKSLRERKRDRTQHDLAEAALKLFAQRGYEETTIEEIADAAFVSPRTFFRYFASKEDLLFSFPSKEHPLFFISEDRFKSALWGVLARDQSVSDLEALGLSLQSLAPEVEVFREQIAMLEAACASSAALRGRTSDARHELERWAAEVVARRRGGETDECVTVATLAMAMYRLATARWLAATDGRPLASCIADAFEQLTELARPVKVTRPTVRRRAAT